MTGDFKGNRQAAAITSNRQNPRATRRSFFLLLRKWVDHCSLQHFNPPRKQPYPTPDDTSSTRSISNTMKLQMPSMRFRSSKGFIAFVVSYAIFTDQFIFTSIIPIAPNMLKQQFKVPDAELARRSSLILSTCGVAMLVASRNYSPRHLPSTSLTIPSNPRLVV